MKGVLKLDGSIKTVADLLTLSGYVKLGTQKGSSFIFCGAIKDLDPEELGKELSDKLDDLLGSAKRTLARVQALKLDWMTYTEFQKTNPTPAGFNKWVESKRKELARCEAYYYKLLAREGGYPCIRKRRILDMYPSFVEEDTWIVIIEGEECGTAWTTEEYIKNKGVCDE